MSNDKVVDSFNIFTCSERGHPDTVRFTAAEKGEFELNMSNHKIDIQPGQFFRLALTKFNMLKNHLNVNRTNDRFFLHTIDINDVERNKEVCLRHGDFNSIAELQVNFIYALIRALGPICVEAGSAVEKIVPEFPIDVLGYINNPPGNAQQEFIGTRPTPMDVSGSPSLTADLVDFNANLFAKELNFTLSFFPANATPLHGNQTDHKLKRCQIFFFDTFTSGPSDCYKLMGGNRQNGMPPLKIDGTLDLPVLGAVQGLIVDIDPDPNAIFTDDVSAFPNSALAGGGAFDPEFVRPDSDSDDDSVTGNDPSTDPPTTAAPPTTTTPNITDPTTGTSITFLGFHPMHLRTDQSIYLRTSLGSVTKNLESSSLSDAVVTRQNETHVHHSNIFAKLTPQFNNDNDYVNFETKTGHEFFLNLYNLKHLTNIKFHLTDSHGLPLQALSQNPSSIFGRLKERVPPVMSFEMVLRVDIIEKNARNEAFTNKPNPGIDPKFSAQITTEQGLIRNF